MFGLQDGVLQDSSDNSLITKNTWKSCKYTWDPYLRLHVLSLAFIYRRYSDKIYDIIEFGTKGCLTTSFLGWKLKISLGQDEPIYTYNHQCTQYFVREACYRGRVGAKIQEVNSSLCTEIKTILQNHLKSNSQDIFNLMQE